MALFLEKTGRRRLAVIAWIMLLGIWLLPTPAPAGWLEKGTRLLESITGSKASTTLSTDDIAAGLKEALRIGTETVVARLGRPDGFNADSAIHIPLPGQLETVRKALSTIGMSQSLDDLELKLNRAAELATPKAKALFWKTISQMTFTDVRGIYNGPDDSATRYFEDKMTPELTREMTPIVTDTLSQAGAVQTYDRIMGQYRALPFVPDVKADLTSYVVEKGLDGIFHYVAKEEAAIREDPQRQTTDLLKRVFGAR